MAVRIRLQRHGKKANHSTGLLQPIQDQKEMVNF